MNDKNIRKSITLGLMALPVLILISFLIFGMLICICQVLTNNLYFFGETKANSISFDTLISTIKKPEFLKSFLYTFYIALVQGILSIIIAVGISYYEIIKGENNKILYIPISMPHIVVAMFIIYLLAKNGMVSHALHSVGLISKASDFPTLVNDKLGVGIIIAYVFKSSAYSLSIIYMTMNKIHKDYFEVVRVLGCDNTNYLHDILLPQLKKTICFCFLIIFIYAFGSYEVPFLLGNMQNKVLPILSYIEYTKPNINARLVSQSYSLIMFAIGIISIIIYAFVVGDVNAKETN